jgi:hypothetical protein
VAADGGDAGVVGHGFETAAGFEKGGCADVETIFSPVLDLEGAECLLEVLLRFQREAMSARTTGTGRALRCSHSRCLMMWPYWAPFIIARACGDRR